MRLVRIVAASMALSLLLAGPALAGSNVNLSVVKVSSPNPVVAGSNLTYLITVANAGPGGALNVSLSDPLPAEVTFVSLTLPAGWGGSVPLVGTNGTVTATIPVLSVAAGDQILTLVVQVGASVPDGTLITNTVTVSTTDPDTDPTNNSSANQTTVAGPAASLVNAAMPEPAASSPLVTLGFVALLLAMLSGAAILAVRRVRP